MDIDRTIHQMAVAARQAAGAISRCETRVKNQALTTIAGLIPLMTERSFQAQLLIPMAASLAFGLMLATFLVLLLIPTFYSIYISVIERLGMHYVEEEE